jgi:hypothetical protein
MFDHTIYLSAIEGVTNMSLVGNYIHGQYGNTCLGVVLVAHGAFNYLNVTDNTIDVDSDKATGGCFGIGLGATASYSAPNYFRHTTVARNTIKNGGAIALSVGNCPACVIEDNLIISDFAYGGSHGTSQWMITGIALPNNPARTSPADDISTATIIRNNTVWFGPRVLGGATGIATGVEGINHIVANNTVVYSSTSAGQGVGCYSFGLPLSSYAFLNNNHCYSAATSSWRVTSNSLGQIVSGSHMSLPEWKKHTAKQGWDSKSVGGKPNFVNATSSLVEYDFHPNEDPALRSPLLGAGSQPNVPKYDRTNSTVFSKRPAIGAYEQTSSTADQSVDQSKSNK